MTNIYPHFNYFESREQKERQLYQHGVTIWFTGLSGSGKSVVAAALEHLLTANGYLSTLLDGDNLRSGLNADLGFSESINYGIEKSVKEGIIRTVGIMMNMDATEHGINLLKDTGVCFGLHTNICVGKPLVDPKLIPSLVDENGYFKSSKTYRKAKEDFVVLDEVLLEVEAQYLRYVELMGEKPHYFELVKQIASFKSIVEKAASEYAPSVIARYLLGLAQSFNKFYSLEKINVEDERVRNSNFTLAKSIRIVINEGLRLLGIKFLNEM